MWAIKSVDDEKGEVTGRLPGLNVERAKGRRIRSEFCEDSGQERIQIRSKPLTIYPSERITKTVVSCRSDMGSYQEECEADDMHGKYYHL